MENETKTRAVFAALTGKPNAGKSSLTNALVGEKIAMISDKPQTTRTKITGILTEGDLQYVFIDTPGIHKSKDKLGTHMNRSVRNAVADIDVAVYVIDCTRPIGEIDRQTIRSYTSQGIPVTVALNKIDLLKNSAECAPIIAEIAEIAEVHSIIPISVKKNDGIDIIKKEIASFAKESVHYFPDDKITDQPEKSLMAEMIREKLLNKMYDEVPHGIAVMVYELVEDVTTKGEDLLDIDAVIYCEKESHKGMIIGKGGSNLREVGTLARQELEQFFRIKVNLRLRVKVKEDWRNREELIKSFGLD